MKSQFPSVANIFPHFQVRGTLIDILPYGTGHINDTYWLKTQEAHCSDYLAQRINHHIFKDIPKLMDNILRVTTHLRTRLRDSGATDIDRRVLTVILSEHNLPYYQDAAGQYWRLYQYIDHSKTYDLVENVQQAYEGGKAFGTFQQLLSDLPGEPLYDTIPNFHNIQLRLVRLEQAVSQNVKQRAEKVHGELAFIRMQADAMQSLLRLGESGHLPIRVTHNDTKFNNVLIDTETQQALCVVDLDTVMPGYVQYDFSDSIRTVTNTAVEDERDLSRIQMSMPYFTAYTRGFLEALKQTLTVTEVMQLAPSAALLPYTIAVRFLTDYLEGDHYFKIHFPEHNLQRARAQLQLTRSILERRTEMAAVIEQVMSE